MGAFGHHVRGQFGPTEARQPLDYPGAGQQAEFDLRQANRVCRVRRSDSGQPGQPPGRHRDITVERTGGTGFRKFLWRSRRAARLLQSLAELGDIRPT